MKILIVVSYYLPEIGSAAHVYHDLAKAFALQGHEVHVLTSYPREYNLNTAEQGKRFSLDEQIDGISIYRVRHPNTRDNIIIRGLEHFILSFYYFRRYKQIGKKFDVCLFYIPPLPLYYLASKIRKYDGTPTILNFQDFHPQELIDVGVLKNPVMIKILEYIERQAYRHADYITVLSHGGIDYIVQRGGNPSKISHIYNGVLLSDHERYSEIRDFKVKSGIEDKFLISYAGILSPFQGIDNILDVAHECQKDHPDIIFYIVGDGMIKNHLKQRIADEKITNVILLPLQPREEYYNIVNSSDINLISLDDRMHAPCIPGKTINLFASGKPVLAVVGSNTETATVINNLYPGLVIEPRNVSQFKDAILNLKKDSKLREDIGLRQKQFLKEQMNLTINVSRYEEIFKKISNRP